MIYAIITFLLFSFVSYRLIGSSASKGRTLFSSLASLVFSSAVYYVFHLKGDIEQGTLIELNHFTFIYFITFVVVSMGFSLLFEMMSVDEHVSEMETTTNPIEKIRLFFKTKLRYLNLLLIIARNGLLKSTLHARKEERQSATAKPLRNTLEDAGGVFIKFGQFLSTRSDLLSESFIEELASLQENVQSIPTEDIKAVIQEQLGQSVDELFESFEEKPLAAASIAQVHRARLKTGEEVVLKVLRPNLKNQVKVDLTILRNFSRLLATKTSWAQQIGIISLTEGFIRNLLEELDLSVELKNIQQMREMRSETVYIPKSYPEYSTPEVLVMEFVKGVSIHKIDEVADGLDREEIANTIFSEMAAQVFDKGVFHGDPHPGNIFLLKNGQPAFIDFGSVGRLSSIQRSGFRWLLIGISKKNADCMVTGVKNLIENSEEVDAKKLEQALSQFLIENTFDGNLIDEMGTSLFSMMSEYGLRFYPDVAGAFRSLITIQGSLQAVNPDFSLTEVIDMYIKSKATPQNIKETVMEGFEEDVLNMLPKLKTLPKRVDNIVSKVENGDLTLRVSFFSDEHNVKYVNSILSLLFMSIAGISFGLLSLGALLLAQFDTGGEYSFLNVFGYAGLSLSVVMLIRVTIQSMRRNK